jgi:hypothetical protein
VGRAEISSSILVVFEDALSYLTMRSLMFKHTLVRQGKRVSIMAYLLEIFRMRLVLCSKLRLSLIMTSF